jgi:hypothetical protein
VTAVAQTDSAFAFDNLPPVEEPPVAHAALAQAASPLGPLAQLPGTWTGHGFNTIWRPHRLTSGQDRFLELNLTTEKIVFTKINGPIPNRGLLMADINMFGLTYMQQIAETKGGAGLHIEPGIWAAVPKTTDPNEPATVVRMASIPHGTVILAQGTALHVNGGPRSRTTTSSPSPSTALRRRTPTSPRLRVRSRSSTCPSRRPSASRRRG